MGDLAQNIGPKLSELRESRKLTQEELEGLSGVPRRTIQNIEHGQTKDPGIGTVLKILSALNYTWSDLEPSEDDVVVSFNDAAELLRAYAASNVEMRKVALMFLHDGDQSYVETVSRQALSRALKLLSPALKLK